MNVQSDMKKGTLQFEGVSPEILEETSPKLSPEEREQIRKSRESEGMVEFYGGGRLNNMVSYLKTNSINKIRSREIYLDLEVGQILPMDDQPRKYFDSRSLDDLKNSIVEQGLTSPIIVRREGDHFRLIAGERRWRAFRELGRKKIPAIIKEVKDEKEAYILAAIENLQREDLNVIEEAMCYQKMIDQGIVASQKELAQIVGRTKSKISERLSLLKLPELVKTLLVSKDLPLTEGHAIELMRVADEKQKEELAEWVVKEKVSRDELRRRIAFLLAEAKGEVPQVEVAAPSPVTPEPSLASDVEITIEESLALPDPSSAFLATPEVPLSVALDAQIDEEMAEVFTNPLREAKTRFTPGPIRFVPYPDQGFDLIYRFRPSREQPGDLDEIIADMNKKMRIFKKLRKEFKRKGWLA